MIGFCGSDASRKEAKKKRNRKEHPPYILNTKTDL